MQSATPRCTVHAQLRAGTLHAHARIENRLPFNKAGFDRAAYRGLLAALHGFYCPLESAFAPCAEAIPDLHWQRRRKAPMLRRDLRQLGLSSADLEQLPDCDRLPRLPTPAQTLGSMYVVEGATLGGQVVQRLLRERLDERIGCALSFFNSYGPQVGAQWRDFLRCLGQLDSPDRVRAAEQAAIETFELLEAWLDVCKVLR